MFLEELWNPRSIFLAVKSCSKALSGYVWGHGKTPCFLRRVVSAMVDVDWGSVDFAVADVKEILE